MVDIISVTPQQQNHLEMVILIFGSKKLQPPLSCNEETEVELWNECYNIEYYTTVFLDLMGSGLILEKNPILEIGNLTNLHSLYLSSNDLWRFVQKLWNLTNFFL